MRGQSYSTARHFIVALEKASAKVPLNATLEAACIASARSNQLYWVATLLIALAASGHQAWAANMYSLIGDYVPKESVASVTGFSGMVGVLAGLMTDFLVSQALTKSGDAGYSAAFLCAGIVYLVVLGLFHLLVRPPPPSIMRES
jgi:MFS-type transporter involved in bile tolerance (Atg22 family)